MASLEQIERALLNAHKAGDTNAAGMLAREIKRLRMTAPPPSAPAQTQELTQELTQEQSPRPAPEWSEVPGQAMQNLGPSAKQFAVDLAQPFLHPIETAQNLRDIAIGGAQNLGAYAGTRTEEEITPEMEKASQVGQFFKDRYGSGEDIRRTLATDPVGALSDVSTVLTGGGALAAKAPMAAGKIGRAVQTAGRAIDPIAQATAPIGWAGRRAFGLTTGVGHANFDELAKGSRSGDPRALDAMRSGASDLQPLRMAKDAMTAMREDRRAAYIDNMRATGADQSVIDMQPIVQKFKDLDDSLQVKGHYKADARVEKTVNEVGEVLAEWWTDPNLQNAVDFDGLKQRIQSLMPENPTDGQKRVVTVMSQAVKREIEARVPSYKKAMADYESMSAQIEDLEKTLSLGDKASTDTALRKLLSGMRNNVNTNFGRRADLIDVLDEYSPGLKAELAGRGLSPMTARGIQGAISPFAAGAAIYAMDPTAISSMVLTSPRAMGEATHYMTKFGPRSANLLFQASRADEERLNRGQY